MISSSPKKMAGYVRLKTQAHNDEHDSSGPSSKGTPGKGTPPVSFTPHVVSHEEHILAAIGSGSASDISGSEDGPCTEFTTSDAQLSFQSVLKENGLDVEVSSPNSQTSSWKLRLLIFICGVIMIIGTALIIHFHNNESKVIIIGKTSLGQAQLSLSQKTLSILDNKLDTRLEIDLAGDRFASLSYETSQNCGGSDDAVCLRWPYYNATLNINLIVIQDNAMQCYNVSWSYVHSNIPKDCIFLDTLNDEETKDHAVWYDTQQYVIWPHVQDAACIRSCYDYPPTQNQFGSNMGGRVTEPMWISSQASLIKVSLSNPLKACTKLCRNASRSTLCLKNEADVDSCKQTQALDESYLTYVICSGSNVSLIHQGVLTALMKPASQAITNKASVYVGRDFEKKLGMDTVTDSVMKSLSQSCSTLMDKPLWNIALNGDVYDRSAIEEELNDIHDIGGTGVVYNMSDLYERIGDFDLHRRSKVKADDFISAMHRMNFKVMLPVSPFINYDAKNFRHAVRDGFLIENGFNGSPLLTNVTLLGGYTFPGMLDFTNPDAFVWFANNIKAMMENVTADFIQLLHGEVTWLPPCYKLHKSFQNPGFYSASYANVANYLGSCPVTNVAFSSQSQKEMVLLQAASGLEDTLKVAIASGLAGYPFFITDLPFHLEEADMLTPPQLEDGFIRWVQLVSFFPVAHMPWDFHILKNRGVNITRLIDMVKKCFSLRQGTVVGPALKSAIIAAEDAGHWKPIISPIWMASGLPGVSNGDFATEKIFLIQDQFMIGNDIMIAPVLQMGMRNRSVYFPPGNWVKLTNPTRNIKSDGKLWLKNVEAKLDDLLIFSRENSNGS